MLRATLKKLLTAASGDHQKVETSIVMAAATHTDQSSEDQAQLLTALQELDELNSEAGNRRFSDDAKLSKSYGVMAAAAPAKFWGDFFERLVAYRTSLWDQESDEPLQVAT